MGTLTAFEQEREARILANKRKLQAMGVLDAKDQFEKDLKPGMAVTAPKRVRKRAPAPAEPSEPRRSLRARPEVNYKEDQSSFNDKLPGEKADRKVKYIDREDIDLSGYAAPKQRSAVDSGKGVRVQGGRVYDSKFGVTCHWCRQKTVENKVTCTNTECGKGCRLPVSFCKMCLKNRHGEDVEKAELSGKWVCPCCRVSCGTGCTLCCNCGPCRKKASLQPTGQVIKEARDAGFGNVHDYLIHQQTGEGPGDIAGRKSSFAWAAWSGQADTSYGVAEAEQAGAATEEAEQVCDKQTTLMDTFPAAKVSQHGKSKTDQLSRKAERKERVMLAMGLAAKQLCV